MYEKRADRKNLKISVWCTPAEKRFMEVRARKAKLSASEFLRELGLKESLRRQKILPAEVLAFLGQLHQAIACLQIISRKRLNEEDLNAIDRAELKATAGQLEKLIKEIKTYLQC